MGRLLFAAALALVVFGWVDTAAAGPPVVVYPAPVVAYYPPAYYAPAPVYAVPAYPVPAPVYAAPAPVYAAPRPPIVVKQKTFYYGQPVRNFFRAIGPADTIVIY